VKIRFTKIQSGNQETMNSSIYFLGSWIPDSIY
jgi:hypothetical protein